MDVFFLLKYVGYKQRNKNGIGVLYMQQRTQLLGGHFSILGTEAGTKITINFPIKSNVKWKKI